MNGHANQERGNDPVLDGNRPGIDFDGLNPGDMERQPTRNDQEDESAFLRRKYSETVRKNAYQTCCRNPSDPTVINLIQEKSRSFRQILIVKIIKEIIFRRYWVF